MRASELAAYVVDLEDHLRRVGRARFVAWLSRQGRLGAHLSGQVGRAQLHQFHFTDPEGGEAVVSLLCEVRPDGGLDLSLACELRAVRTLTRPAETVDAAPNL